MHENNSILITGGAGFIGSSLALALLKRKYKVTVIDNFNAYYDPEYKKRNISALIPFNAFNLINGDITNSTFLHDVFDKNKFDKVIHLAASVGVRNSLIHPETYKKNNILGTELVLNESIKHNIRQFVFASSSSVYGNLSPVPFTEDRVVESDLNPYARSKKAGEALCFDYHEKYRLPVTVFRFFTVYGPNGRPDMSPYLFTDAILSEREFDIYGDGSAKRDYTYIDDLIDGIELGLNKIYPFEIFNLASSRPITVLDFIRLIEVNCGKKAKMNFKKKNEYEMGITYANIKKAKTMLGFNPKTEIIDGLRIFINWYKAKRFNNDTLIKL